MKDLEIQMPSVKELEEVVLGACLIEREAISQVAPLLTPEMFYQEVNRTLYTAILELYKNDGMIDILTVTEALKRMGKLDEIGGPYTVTSLSGKVASTAHLSTHIALVREYYLRRTLIEGLRQQLTNAIDLQVDFMDTIVETQALIDRLLNDNPAQDGLKDMEEVMNLTMSDMERRIRLNQQGITGISTGLKELDEMNGGWQGGESTVLAARTGVGKTALALHFALTAAQNGHKAVIFSLEMQANRLGDRMLLSRSDLPAWNFKKGLLDNSQVAAAQHTAGELTQYPITVQDDGNLTMDNICMTAKYLYSKQQCDIVFIDYLQFCRPEHAGRTREQEVAEASRKAKALAKQLNIPVVLLSQLNRDADSRPSQVPRLSDLRESGSIEQDADLVILLYRPSTLSIPTDKETGFPTEGLGVGIVAKNRNGQTGKFYFGHNPEMTKIGDYMPPAGWIRKNAR